MALLNRGRLFAGALFAGALFAGQLAQEPPIVPPVVETHSGGGGGWTEADRQRRSRNELQRDEKDLTEILSIIIASRILDHG